MTELLAPALDDDTSGVPFAITNRRLIPAQRYYDKDFFELEKRKLWPHVWQNACRLEEIPNVGDYVEYWVADQSVIVVRTSATEIKAYQNACRHRATQLAVGCGTFRGGQIVCPFHGWRWNLDGTSSFVYGRDSFPPECVTEADLRLVECQVDTWANCVFINMDPDAPLLQQQLAPMPSLLDPSPAHLRGRRGFRFRRVPE
jgi:phenylpropionate dioxygenase-like ring-hydroxylating dioxygenase large terminal subunit